MLQECEYGSGLREQARQRRNDYQEVTGYF
jgi:hypothetical protein